MKKKLTLSLLTTTLLAFQAANANLPPKPEACPSVSAIQSVGIDMVGQLDNEWAAGVVNNKYGTNEEWSFVIRDIRAENEADARAKANEALHSLALQLGPISHTAKPAGWGCLYKSDKGYFIATITPALSFDVVVRKI